jgi:hypothetical protein
MNKYAAGGKCGSMSSASSPSGSSGTLNIAALMAQREKDDMFFSAKAQPSLQQEQQLIVKKKDNQSDIDIILGGD